MGTSNFHNVNAHNVYAVMMNYESPVIDEDGNETEETEYRSVEHYEVEDFVDNIRYDAEESVKENGLKFYKELEMTDPHSLRSFESTPLFQLYTQKNYGDVDVQVNINCVARHGYYEGASLDWFLTCTYAGQVELIEDTDFEIYDNMSYMNAGLRKVQAKNAEAWVESIKDLLINAVEKIFTEHSMPLTVTARFSNGETHYSKI